MTAPDRILARADRNGARWKVKTPSPWFGEAFDDELYIRRGAFDISELRALLDEIDDVGVTEWAMKLERVLTLLEQEDAE